MSADTGLGWPFEEEPSAGALGWPNLAPAVAPTNAPSAAEEPIDPASQASGDAGELPMAASIREDLAAVSRETAALRPSDPSDANPAEAAPSDADPPAGADAVDF